MDARGASPVQQHNDVKGSHNQGRAWFTQTRDLDIVLLVFRNYRVPSVKSKQHNTGPKRERYLGGCLFRGDLQGGGSDGTWGGEAEGRSGTQAVS